MSETLFGALLGIGLRELIAAIVFYRRSRRCNVPTRRAYFNTCTSECDMDTLRA